MPDDELSQLAARGELRRAGRLARPGAPHARRPRAQAFAANFAEQWLQTRRLTELAPDPKLFPDFDEPLRSAMIRETRLFCRSIQDEDRSVLDFLDAADTFVNERLARHYGLAGVSGDDFRRVSLASTPRRGILTQASILAVTSNPTRTSPVKRGKWILENILGMPPRRRRPGVEALKEDGAVGSGHALRERMERHRTDPDCARATAAWTRSASPWRTSMPSVPGAAMTMAGRSMTRDGSRPAANSEVPRACEPCSARGGMRSPAASPRRCSPTRWAAASDRSDRRAVDRIVARLAHDGYRFSALVLAIVESQPFREPAKPGGPPMRRTSNISRQDRPEGARASRSPCRSWRRCGPVSCGPGRPIAPMHRCAWRSSTSPTASTCPTGRRGPLRRRPRSAPDPRAAARGQGRRPRPERVDPEPGTGPGRRRRRSRAGHGQLPDRPPPAQDRRGRPPGRYLRRPARRPGGRVVDPLPLAGDRLRGWPERRRMRPRL